MSNLGYDNESTRIKKVAVKSYNVKQLAWIYDVSKFVMRKLIKRFKDLIGEIEKGSKSYSVKQVRLIFELIPLPSNVKLIMA